MVTWIAEFRLSITRALADQLATTLQPLTPAPLNLTNLGTVQARPGVYVLFVGGERAYVGKASRSLRDRLGQHHRKLSGRSGIDLAGVRFACVYVDEDLDAAAPEKLLIKKYRDTGTIPWNTNGFGNKDPGRNRDKSVVKVKHFDALYPIDLDYVLNLPASRLSAAELLEALKRDLPYLLRYDTTSVGKALFKQTHVELPGIKLTTRDAMALIVGALSPGWQATALPGYLILYKEEASYDSALFWWRHDEGGAVLQTQGPQRFDAGEVEQDDLFS